MVGRNTKLKQYPVHTPYKPNSVIKGRLLDVYDGDTFWIVTRDLNNEGKEERLKVRLAGINTEEMKSKSQKSVQAKEHLIAILDGKEIECVILGVEKFGRPLVLVRVHDCPNVNRTLVELELAVLYMDTFNILEL
jgi:endonuclease YncB( thermonuclease family)